MALRYFRASSIPEEKSLDARMKEFQTYLHLKIGSYAPFIGYFHNLLTWQRPVPFALGCAAIHLVLWNGAKVFGNFGFLSFWSLSSAVGVTAWFAGRHLLADFVSPTSEAAASQSVLLAYGQSLKYITFVRFSVPNVFYGWKSRMEGPDGLTVYFQTILVLFSLACLGFVLSGFVLMWLFVYAMLLAPGIYFNGLHHRGIDLVKPYVSEVVTEVMQQIYSHINDEPEDEKKEAKDQAHIVSKTTRSSVIRQRLSIPPPNEDVCMLREASDEELAGFFKIG